MSTSNKSICYDENFKRTLVNLYQSGDKTQTILCKEYRGFKLLSLVGTNNMQPLKQMMVKS